MNDSSTPAGQFNVLRNLNTVRVKIPDIRRIDSGNQADFRDSSVGGSVGLRPVINDGGREDDPLRGYCELPSTVGPASRSDLQKLKNRSLNLRTMKVDRMIDSIQERFPIEQSISIVFVGCKTDAETDHVSADVAQRLAQRKFGPVLLVDSNTKSQGLSADLKCSETEGIGNVVCKKRPWRDLLQTGPVDGLDFLPYGNVNTAKTLRSRTFEFLDSAKQVYQYICVSAGLNDGPISKSFCSAADGIYLLVDLNQVSHAHAKFAADRLQLNNQPLVGCIALEVE